MRSDNPPIDTRAVLEHLDWVRGLACSLVKDPGRAEDVVQETWLAALRRSCWRRRPTRLSANEFELHGTTAGR